MSDIITENRITAAAAAQAQAKEAEAEAEAEAAKAKADARPSIIPSRQVSPPSSLGPTDVSSQASDSNSDNDDNDNNDDNGLPDPEIILSTSKSSQIPR
jgi:hypothetical protein